MSATWPRLNLPRKNGLRRSGVYFSKQSKSAFVDQSQEGQGLELKLVVRYFLAFVIPLLASLLLFYGSFPLRAEAHQISNEWLSLILSSNDLDKGVAFAALRSDEHTIILKRMGCLAIFTILLASFVCALIIPPNLSPERKLNLLMAMVIGFCAAEFAIGFGFLNWLDFVKAAVTGLILAGLVVWLRSAIIPRRNR